MRAYLLGFLFFLSMRAYLLGFLFFLGSSTGLSEDELDTEDFFFSKRANLLGVLGLDTSRELSEEELLSGSFLSSSLYLGAVLLGISRELSDGVDTFSSFTMRA